MPGCLSEGLHSLRSPATISALIYETREECDEVKKNKGRGRENKQALHCDLEYAAVIEADLKKFTKTFVPAAAAVHNQPFFLVLLQSSMPAFYGSNHGTAIPTRQIPGMRCVW